METDAEVPEQGCKTPSRSDAKSRTKYAAVGSQTAEDFRVSEPALIGGPRSTANQQHPRWKTPRRAAPEAVATDNMKIPCLELPLRRAARR